MSLKKSVLLSIIPWIVGISALHAWLNLDLFRRAQASKQQFKVGFIPVT